MNKTKFLIIILISSLVAMFTSIYLLNQHYSNQSSFCNISENFSCDVVNRSIYSEILGIPISLISIITFYFISISMIALLKEEKLFVLDNNDLIKINFYLIIASFIFSLYLIYIQAFVLFTICILCVLLDILIIINLISIKQLKNF